MSLTAHAATGTTWWHGREVDQVTTDGEARLIDGIRPQHAEVTASRSRDLEVRTT